MTLAACRSYEPAPVDLGAFLHDWEHAAEVLPAGWTHATAEGAVLERNLRLASERAALTVQLEVARHAGLAPDPSLSVSLVRAVDDLADPWLTNLGAAWTWPWTRARAARVDVAEARFVADVLRFCDLELVTLAEFTDAWATWDAARAVLEVERGFADDLGKLAAMLARLADAGEASPLEAGLADAARRRAEARATRAERELEARRVALAAALDLPTDTPFLRSPVDAPVLLEAGDPATHPRVRAALADHQVAEEELRLAVALQWPAWQLGPQANDEEGQLFLGLNASIPLPLWNRNRGGIARAVAERDEARTRAELALVELLEARAAARAAHEAAHAEAEALASDVRPALEAQLARARDLIALGEAPTVLLLEVLAEARETALDHVHARRDAAAAAARWNALATPPDDPADDPSLGTSSR